MKLLDRLGAVMDHPIYRLANVAVVLWIVTFVLRNWGTSELSNICNYVTVILGLMTSMNWMAELEARRLIRRERLLGEINRLARKIAAWEDT